MSEKEFDKEPESEEERLGSEVGVVVALRAGEVSEELRVVVASGWVAVAGLVEVEHSGVGEEVDVHHQRA